MCSAADRTRLDSVLRCCKRLGYCRTDQLAVADMFSAADDDFFIRIKSNGHHALQPGVRSSRRHAISATAELATNQLGDNQLGDTSRSTRRQLISCLSLYIFSLVGNRHIHFGTSVVQRYHKFGDPMHSSAVPPHTCPTVRLNPPNPVSVSLDQTKCQICR